LRKPRLLRRIAAVGGSLAIGAGALVAMVGLSALPASAGGNPNVTYEFDCTTTLSPGTVAPFAVTTNLNATPDPSFPSGATYGAAGAISETLVGPFVAGLAGNGVVTAGTASLGLTITGLGVGPTDAHSTGSYSYSQTFPKIIPASVNAGAASWAASSHTINVTNTSGISVGDGPDAVSGIPNGATVVGIVTNTSLTINIPTTAAGSKAALPVFQADTFTDAAVSTGNVFMTSGANGQVANIGLVDLTGGVSIDGNLTVPFGTGGAGVGTNNCLETGYQDAAGTLPGPAQPPDTGPAFPPQASGGPGSLLILASGGFVAQPGTSVLITPPTAAFVNLVDPPPVASNLGVNLGVGGTKTVTLPATDTDATPVTGCSLVGTPPYGGRLNVSVSNSPTPCQATLTDTGAGPAIVTFQFTATDGVGTSNAATVTVSIGTPPVDEPLTQQVNAGQLVLSCNSPESYLQPAAPLPNPQYTTNAGAPNLTAPTQGPQTAPSNSGPGTISGMTVPGTTGGWQDFAGTTHNLASNPGATTANPQLKCPEFQFPIIQLNGLQQTTQGNGSTLYVSDNRGDPTVGWTLTASMVPTPSGPSNPNGNPNASCNGLADFCNASVGTHATDPNGQIAAGNLSIGSITCVPHTGNLNPAATPGAGGSFASTQTICTAAATQSGGTFDVTKTYTLVIPSSVYAGNYWGTVEYLVS
jgi:hypothetical protein